MPDVFGKIKLGDHINNPLCTVIHHKTKRIAKIIMRTENHQGIETPTE